MFTIAKYKQKYIVYASIFQNSGLIEDDYEIKHTIRRQPFQWKQSLPDVVANNTNKIVPCRNSVQGKVLIVDERGKVILMFYITLI